MLINAGIYGQLCSVNTSHTDAACYGVPTGTISITVSGGSEPYAFDWSGPGSFSSSNQNLSGLAAGTYILTVRGNGDSCTGIATVSILQPDEPLSIRVQPADQTDCYGNTVEFSVEVINNSGRITYQWQHRSPGGSFSDIPGENSSVLTVRDIGVNGENIDDTEFRVIVSDECGSFSSEAAILNINSITGITGRVNLTICDGENTSYRVSSEGQVTGYQWSFNNGTGWQTLSDDGTFSGTSGEHLMITDASSDETGGYRVSVTFTTLNQPPDFPTCIITSHTRNRNLTVLPPVAPPILPQDQNICYNSVPALLTGTPAAGGSGPPYSYQWQVSTDRIDWTDINGEQGLSYSPPSLTTSTWYRIAVTDSGPMSCGTAYSYPSAVIVIPLPETSAIFHH